MFFHNTPVKFLKRIGSARVSALKSRNIHTIEDLLYVIPFRYENRLAPVKISEMKPGKFNLVKGKIFNVSVIRARNRMTIINMTVESDGEYVKSVWFNQPYLAQQFKKNYEIWLYGKSNFGKSGVSQEFRSPDFEVLPPGERDNIHTGRIVPVYKSIKGITNKMLRRIIYDTLFETDLELEEVLPAALVRKRGITSRADAFKRVHFPSENDNIEKMQNFASDAHYRLIYEELLLLQSSLYLIKKKRRSEAGIRVKVGTDFYDNVSSSLPFKLTNAQEKAVTSILKDLSADYPMRRLLQGDVGSGKTIVALIAVLAVIKSGFKAAVMVPTEILAEQHYRTALEFSAKDSFNTVLLTSSSIKQDKQIHAKIKNGDYDLVIGTQALIQEGVKFSDLGLVVIDEQHRFGVEQRETLIGKGEEPNILVMTATPIPRSLALTAFGNLDLTIIDQLPKGRKPVETILTTERKREEIYGFMRKSLEAGRQAYVVYPLVEQTAKSDLLDATRMAENLKTHFKEFTVELIHGRMQSEEKEEVMRRFKDGDIAILVSTTVIEVGIDVPNASVMLIEHSERYGLSQLHQLRGRIGRGRHKSYCILMINPPGSEGPESLNLTEDAQKRLQVMRESNDGFVIAQKDLEIRGPGEFLGKKQSGLPRFRIADLGRDYEILMQAYSDAQWFFSLPDIAGSPDYEEYLRYLREWWKKHFQAH